MKLAKLILHFNTPELTDSLCRMVPGAIVIDNGSGRYPYRGANRCVRQDNLGFTKGWNAAIKTLYEEFDAFWLMNSDIKVDRDSVAWVEKHLRDGHSEFFTPAFNCWMKHCQPRAGFGLMETGVMEFTAPVIHKSVFERIGFFDEVFALGYGVEFDFCYRARQAGIKMHVSHLCQFYHLGQQTISKHEGLLTYSRKANFELTHGLLNRYGDHYMDIVFKGLNIKTDFEMKLAVYTTIFGDYDTLKPVPEQEVKADYFVITDNPELKAEGWKTIVVDYPRADLHPRLRAKFFKLFPWECDALKGYQLTIYIDASIRVTAPNFVATCVKNLRNDMLLFRHPQRNCIYAEGMASIGLVKYDDEPIAEQLAFYHKFHPSNAGLYAGGVLVRKHTDLVKRMMADWWFENIKYSYQDQLSLPVIFSAHKFTPSVFEENQYRCSFFQVEWHDDKKVSGSDFQVSSLTPPAPASRDHLPLTGEETLRAGDVGESGRWDEKEWGKPPVFTVLMPVWKTPVDKLNKAVHSIMDQTCRDFELLIVDDNNQDPDVLFALSKYEELDRVRIIRTKENKGLASALDFGLSYAAGTYVVRMDSDDIAHRDLLKTHLSFFESAPDAVICGVQMNLVIGGRKKRVTMHPAVVDRSRAFRSNGYWFVNHPGICYRLDVVKALGCYGSTPAAMPEDYVLWCKFLKAGHVIYNSPKILMDYTVGDGSQIGQDRKSVEWKQFLEDTKQTYLRD